MRDLVFNINNNNLSANIFQQGAMGLPGEKGERGEPGLPGLSGGNSVRIIINFSIITYLWQTPNTMTQIYNVVYNIQ